MNTKPQPPEGRVFIADFENKMIREKATKPFPTCEDQVDENIEGTFKERCMDYLPYMDSLKQYPATWLTKEMDGKELVEGKDFEVKEKYEPHTAYNSKENQNRDTPIAGFMVKVAIHISAPPATVIQKETIEYCDVCGVTDRCAEYQQEGSCDSIRKTVVESPTVIQPLGLQEMDEPFEYWVAKSWPENNNESAGCRGAARYAFEWVTDYLKKKSINESTPPPQPLGIDVEDMAKASLRETFNKWTGKTCTDDQWDEYLEKESIQLTLAAMIHFKDGYAASKSSAEEAIGELLEVLEWLQNKVGLGFDVHKVIGETIAKYKQSKK